MSAAVAERTVARPNPKGDEAAPIVEKELYDVETGERIPKGWERQPCERRAVDWVRDDRDRPMVVEDEFTIPGPDYIAVGLQSQYMPKRPGRYIVPGRLEGRVW